MKVPQEIHSTSSSIVRASPPACRRRRASGEKRLKLSAPGAFSDRRRPIEAKMRQTTSSTTTTSKILCMMTYPLERRVTSIRQLPNSEFGGRNSELLSARPQSVFPEERMGGIPISEFRIEFRSRQSLWTSLSRPERSGMEESLFLSSCRVFRASAASSCWWRSNW